MILFTFIFFVCIYYKLIIDFSEVININPLRLIGNTPIVRLEKSEQYFQTNSHIYAKLESKNLFGSIKDRAAIKIVETAEKNGYISKNSYIIEATSGNMGIALAGICKIKGYKCKIVMPENMSEKRKLLLKEYDADLILTPAALGMQGAINCAKKLKNKISNSYYVDQFNNIASVEAHRIMTAPEINRQLKGSVDIIIAGMGTGATIRGLYEYFRTVNPKTAIIGVLPSKFPHNIQGIGAGFQPPFINKNNMDEIIYIDDDEAFTEKTRIYKIEGLFVGLSSGAVIAALKKIVNNYNSDHKNIVLIFPDGGDRYEK